MTHLRPRTIAAGLAITALLTGCSRSTLSSLSHNSTSTNQPTATQRPTTAPTPTTAGALSVIDEPEAGFAPVDHAITSAHRSVDVTMYELVDTTAEADLVADAARGVDVRVILDQNREKSHNETAYTYLNAHGVHAVWANPRYQATHQKTLTIDNALSIIMTANLVTAYYPTTRDFLVTDTDPADVAAIEATFNADLTGQTITPPLGQDLVWSPTNAESTLLTIINSATHSLAVENEEMSSTVITKALASAANRRVNVTITMTASSQYTKALTELTAAGAHVATYPHTSKALYIHAKTVIADADTSTARAFVGSENFSTASLTRNRELGIDDTTNPTIASAIAQTVNTDHAGAQPFPS